MKVIIKNKPTYDGDPKKGEIFEVIKMTDGNGNRVNNAEKARYFKINHDNSEINREAYSVIVLLDNFEILEKVADADTGMIFTIDTVLDPSESNYPVDTDYMKNNYCYLVRDQNQTKFFKRANELFKINKPANSKEEKIILKTNNKKMSILNELLQEDFFTDEIFEKIKIEGKKLKKIMKDSKEKISKERKRIEKIEAEIEKQDDIYCEASGEFQNLDNALEEKDEEKIKLILNLK